MVDYKDFEGVARPMIEAAFRSLLETKHLYQSVEFTTSGMSGLVDAQVERATLLQSLEIVQPGRGGRGTSKGDIVKESWADLDRLIKMTPFQFHETPFHGDCMVLSVPTVRTFCQNQNCGGLWPHNACQDPSWLRSRSISGNGMQQIFVLQYECQNCKGEPVSYLVKRDGAKITLTGRSPIEKVNVPNFIPKNLRKYYRGALVAFNSGANLPAIFMLRTMVEQHMRSAVKAGAQRMTGEELAAAYSESLGQMFNSQFQSLRPVYAALSEAIHAAVDDKPEIFEAEHAKTLKHFEAKDAIERLSVNFGKDADMVGKIYQATA